MSAKPGSGTIVDGSKVLHAAKIFRPKVKAPKLPKDKPSKLVYMGKDQWELLVGDEVSNEICTGFGGSVSIYAIVKYSFLLCLLIFILMCCMFVY